MKEKRMWRLGESVEEGEYRGRGRVWRKEGECRGRRRVEEECMEGEESVDGRV